MTTKETPFDKYIEAQKEPETPFDKHIEKAQSEQEGIPLMGRFAESLVNAFGATPDAIIDMLNFAGGAKRQMVTGQPMPEGAEIPGFPRPTLGEFHAGVQALPELMPGGLTFTESYGAELAKQDAMRRITEKESPLGYAAASLGGEAAAMLAGRMPFTKGLRRAEGALMSIKPEAPVIMAARSKYAQAPLGVKEAISNAFGKSTKLRGLGRAGLRAAEAGVEATMLNVINEGDPGDMFALAAGMQLAESGVLGLGQKAMGSGTAANKAGRLALYIFGGAALWSQFQNLTPLYDDFNDAMTAASQKVTPILTVGALAGLAGGGRLRGSNREMTKVVETAIDAVTGIPRNMTHGLIRQLKDADPEEQEAAEALMRIYVMNWGALKDSEISRIDAAIQNKTFPATAMALMRDNEFLERVSNMPEPKQEAQSFSPFDKPFGVL